MTRFWSACVTPAQARARDDSQIVQQIHDIMDSAEVIAGHNVDRFDLKRLNTRFMKHGLTPIINKRTIDTLKLARSRLALESNTLDYIAGWFGKRGKDKITHEDWLLAEAGDKKTLKKILDYNINDVKIGADVLTALMPLANKPAHWGTLKGEGRVTADMLRELAERVKGK